MMEEALNSSSITAEHRALMDVVFQAIRSINSELKEAFGGLLTGFEKLKSSDEELDLVNNRFDEAQGLTLSKDCLTMTTAVAADVVNLKAELEKAKQEAVERKAATERAAAELSIVKTVSDKHEARVAEVQQELKDAITKCEDLEQKNKGEAAELSKVNKEIHEARSEMQGAREELRQVKLIADGKPYLLQSVFGGHRFALLTQVWHSSGTFADLLRSAADATRHFASREGNAEHKLLWA
nr:cilia- and flagella-associated protein 58-like [Aegilops tauschii subsp. strangulata]